MNLFSAYQNALEETFPSLNVFSQLNWDEVAREYIATHENPPTDLADFVFNFPAFLQDKSEAGDAPSYLFELAYYELIQAQVVGLEVEYPSEKGFHLNPSLSFLHLEYDIALMMDEAIKGNVNVIEKPHILCLFRHRKFGPNHADITSEFLAVLRILEASSLTSTESLTPTQAQTLVELVELGLVIENK